MKLLFDIEITSEELHFLLHSIEKDIYMTTQYVTDGLALIATVVNTTAADAENKAAMAKLSAKLAENQASDADVKILVDALIKQVSAAPIPTSLPVVSSLSSASGAVNGGESVVITGTGFTGALAVHFGSLSATSFTVDSDTQITAVSPAQAAGIVNVTVTGTGGVSAIVSADNYNLS